jgi:acyl carrier protein
MAELENELKALIIQTLELEDITIDDIVTSEPLFEDGLGLDSIDALEIGLALQQKYGVEIDEESEETRLHFASIANLAKFVAGEQAHK